MKININKENIYKLFTSKEIEINDSIYNRIYGKSYVLNPYIDLCDLRYLTIPYYDFNGNIEIGEMICNKYIALDVLSIFKELFDYKYQIKSIKLIEDFWDKDSLSSDEVSMHADNSSCFNFRLITGKKKLSNHALGQAIDINPVENPYIRRDENDNNIYDSLSEEEIYYANNRNINDPHIIKKDDFIYNLFKSYGFSWGGDWGNPFTDSTYEKGDPVDYQHFEKEVIDRRVIK